MLETISPYALLKQSRPKEPASYVTEYDLYSAAQRSDPPVSPPPLQSEASLASASYPAAPVAASLSRTHYISGIQQRHNMAIRRAQLTGASLSNHSDSTQAPLT